MACGMDLGGMGLRGLGVSGAGVLGLRKRSYFLDDRRSGGTGSVSNPSGGRADLFEFHRRGRLGRKNKVVEME